MKLGLAVVLIAGFSVAEQQHSTATSTASVSDDLGRKNRLEGAASRMDAAKMTTIDLSDSFIPLVLRIDEGRSHGGPDPYVAKVRQLADEQGNSGENRNLELFGIFPTFRVLRARMLEHSRHRCEELLDKRALRGAARAFRGDGSARRDPAVVNVLQELLRCQQLLPSSAQPRVMDFASITGLRAFQRRNMLLAWGTIDLATERMLMLSSLERDYEAVLRALRERVVAATGLIEDGTASATQGLVVGRLLDDPGMRAAASAGPLPNGAPDLVSGATDAAARALGWTSAESTRAWFAACSADYFRDGRVALSLPPPPNYTSSHMDVRVEIDRGDVWYDYPYRSDGTRRSQPITRRPTLVLFTRVGDTDIPLVRWNTTIGGWQPEKIDTGEIAFRYKESGVGFRLWRNVVAFPAWLPPDSTPDRELMRRTGSGRYQAKQALLGPGYESAYGLVMMPHLEPVTSPNREVSEVRYRDHGVRTHGSVNYRSILGGYSHGCHRLFNHLALRLSSYLLMHRVHQTQGNLTTHYRRAVFHGGWSDTLKVSSRGYSYELTPPVPVQVHEGTVRGRLRNVVEEPERCDSPLFAFRAGVGEE